jgi:hypothetical protein
MTGGIIMDRSGMENIIMPGVSGVGARWALAISFQVKSAAPEITMAVVQTAKVMVKRVSEVSGFMGSSFEFRISSF